MAGRQAPSRRSRGSPPAGPSLRSRRSRQGLDRRPGAGPAGAVAKCGRGRRRRSCGSVRPGQALGGRHRRSAAVQLPAGGAAPRSPGGRSAHRWGVATSGTSIHHWNVDGTTTHHLIDPRTGLPAVTDVVQATVVAGSALRAEALAKAAVIAGSVEVFAVLERAHVRGAVLLSTSGKVQALPVTMPLLAV